ncbi:uncharacterized protein B0I36DRAFT_361110 [Microdochium trichocladiopsis]|uniref:Nucleoporin NUP49/NSP49 n=1 Tax=Microdochium trichocladiopsis TaxID=1682393 RepID=A0A9P8YCJ7_9PEZI|nr:uncharacterized protein B0I36DRAFT_361110 [Microdochium trichocladiopsis]KAH7035782.1 hypothetical protein B0I36DRAFT_361110 [Microdochium trichocladiopsis]
MALARSASGPGLSINTGSAGSLFGSSTANSQPAAPATSSLFGSKPATGGGLFGNTSTATSTAPAQAATTTTPSLFGGATASQPQQTQPSSLFGGSILNKPAPTTATSSLFGGAAATPQATTQQPQQSQQQQQQQPSMLGSSLLGSAGQQQQTVPGVRIDVSNLKGTTRFTDLTDELQKLLEQVDKGILHQLDYHQQVRAFMLGHGPMLDDIPNDVKFVASKYQGVRGALEADAQAIEVARGLVKEDADHARLSFRAIDNLKLPQQYHAPNLWAPRSTAAATANTESDGQDLVSFFSATADEMDKQLNKYQQNLSEIESHLHGVQHGLVEELQKLMASKNGAPSGVDDRIQDLVAVLRDFEQGILRVAGQVGGAREGMTRLQLGDFMGGSSGNGSRDF